MVIPTGSRSTPSLAPPPLASTPSRDRSLSCLEQKQTEIGDSATSAKAACQADVDIDDADVTDSLLGVPKEGVGIEADLTHHHNRVSHNGKRLHTSEGGGGGTSHTNTAAYQDDVKIGDGMDIAIHGENGETCNPIPTVLVEIIFESANTLYQYF